MGPSLTAQQWQRAEDGALAASYGTAKGPGTPIPALCQHCSRVLPALGCALSVSPASFPLSGGQCGKERWYPLSSSLQRSVTLHGNTTGRGQGVPSPARDASLTPPHWFPRQGRVGSSAQHHPRGEHFSVASALAHFVPKVPWPPLGQQIHPSPPCSILSSQDAAGVHHQCIWLHSS